jgi:hypothetical protein
MHALGRYLEMSEDGRTIADLEDPRGDEEWDRGRKQDDADVIYQPESKETRRELWHDNKSRCCMSGALSTGAR